MHCCLSESKMEEMNKRFVNIILGSSDWKLYHRKEFTKALANNGEVLTYVNLPVSLIVNLFIKFKTKFIAYFTGKLKVNNNNGFNVFTPLIITHYKIWRRSQLVANIDSHFFALQINRYIRKYYPGFNVRLWVYIPEHKYFINKVNYDLLVYDSYDDCDLNFDGSVNEVRAKLNRILLETCDFVIVISKFTYDKYSKYTKNIFRSRGGYTSYLFDNNTESNIIIDKGKPILGYIGTFRDWIDYTIIDSLIETNEFTLVFIGYVDRSSKEYFDIILKNENVIHINYIEISKIPMYLKNFTAGLIPFKINDFMKSVYPNKFFEYVSSKIPVVTTALPELKMFENYLGYSKDNYEFLDNCRKAARGELVKKISRYDEIKKNNDWNSIVKEIIIEIKMLK